MAENTVIHWDQGSSEMVNSLPLSIWKEASHQKISGFFLQNVNHILSAHPHYSWKRHHLTSDILLLLEVSLKSCLGKLTPLPNLSSLRRKEAEVEERAIGNDGGNLGSTSLWTTVWSLTPEKNLVYTSTTSLPNSLWYSR